MLAVVEIACRSRGSHEHAQSLKAYGRSPALAIVLGVRKRTGSPILAMISRRLSYRPRGVSVPVPRLPLSYALLHRAGTVRQYCWKGQLRLTKRYSERSAKGKPIQVVVTSVNCSTSCVSKTEQRRASVSLFTLLAGQYGCVTTSK